VVSIFLPYRRQDGRQQDGSKFAARWKQVRSKMEASSQQDGSKLEGPNSPRRPALAFVCVAARSLAHGRGAGGCHGRAGCHATGFIPAARIAESYAFSMRSSPLSRRPLRAGNGMATALHRSGAGRGGVDVISRRIGAVIRGMAEPYRTPPPPASHSIANCPSGVQPILDPMPAKQMPMKSEYLAARVGSPLTPLSDAGATTPSGSSPRL
jgi:hypothetical protein